MSRLNYLIGLFFIYSFIKNQVRLQNSYVKEKFAENKTAIHSIFCREKSLFNSKTKTKPIKLLNRLIYLKLSHPPHQIRNY